MAKTPREQLGVDLPDPTENQVVPYAAAVAEEAAVEEPELILGKFKDADSLAASYTELESRLGREAQERQQMQAQLQQLTELVQNQPQQVQQPAYDDQQAQLYAAYEQDPVGTMAWLAQNAAQAAAQQAVAQVTQRDPSQEAAQAQMFAATVDQEMERRFPDWQQSKQDVGAVLTELPYLLPENPTFEQAQTALAAAYDVAHARRAASAAADGRSAKIAAQTITGQTGRQQTPDEGAEKLARLAAAYRGSSYAAVRNSG